MSIETNRILQERGFIIAKNGMGVNGYSRLEPQHFAALADKIGHNDQLLHPNKEQMAKSYLDGKAVAIFDANHTIIGYNRFGDATTPRVREILRLPSDFPTITELGTVYIDEAYQGLGLNPIMQNELLSTVNEDIQDRKLLILLTTKTQKVINSLNKASALGIDFSVLSHTDPRASMIAPFTCTCSGEFGSGFGEGNTMKEKESCPKRVGAQELVQIKTKADLARQGVKPEGDPTLHCTMGVSDIDLMIEMNQRLLRQFGRINAYDPRGEMVKLLQAAGHFD